jgi:hypothetical protein
MASRSLFLVGVALADPGAIVEPVDAPDGQ